MYDVDVSIMLRVPVRESEHWPGRYVFAFGFWDDLDLQVCCHAEKLRWQCDGCDEMREAMQEPDHD